PGRFVTFAHDRAQLPDIFSSDGLQYRTTRLPPAVRMPGPQAEAVLRVIEEPRVELATRQDIAELRQWSVVTFATQVQIAEMKIQMAEMKVELIKWMVGLGFSFAGLVLAGVYFILGHFKP
ncbi:MAG TPA: hypothetical protein VEO95_02350, partial [Chthoniobacteraceae bacterium]|nr:hypothetical protein [Chthoniobacteraceae bacterium]